MFNPTISPHDPKTVLISCDMTGSYITHDAGQSWRMFNLRGVVRFFVFDPINPKIIYAQATGLWRSADGGETWNLLYPEPSTVKEVVILPIPACSMLRRGRRVPLCSSRETQEKPGRSRIVFPKRHAASGSTRALPRYRARCSSLARISWR